jgi:hypothetical protein
MSHFPRSITHVLGVVRLLVLAKPLNGIKWVACLFQFDPHEGFQKVFTPRFSQVFKSPFGASISFTPDF